MAIRTKTEDVKRLINTSLDDSDTFIPIQVASRLVDDLLVGKGMTAGRLQDIELYLAAHFVAVRDQDAGQLTRLTVGDTDATYGGDLGQALSFTRYGQQALALDISGTLASVGKVRAQFRAFG